MSTLDRIRSFLASSPALAFSRADFAPLGGESQVGKALRFLMDEAILVRIHRAHYVRARLSARGVPIPVAGFDGQPKGQGPR